MKKLLTAMVDKYRDFNDDVHAFLTYAPILTSAIIAVLTVIFKLAKDQHPSLLSSFAWGLVYGWSFYIFFNILFWVPFALITWVSSFFDETRKG